MPMTYSIPTPAFNTVKQYAHVFLLILLSFSLATSLYAEEEDNAVDNTQYYELSPPFVVNLQTNERRMRFLQVRVQVLGSPSAITEVQKHNAPLRDVIITSLASQTRDNINTPKKKKTLQDKIQEAAENVLKELTGKKQIEGLYFTNFVVQ